MQNAECRMQNEDLRQTIMKMLYNAPCCPEMEGEPGNCPYRRNGRCREINKLDICAMGLLADLLIANGMVQKWIPVTEGLPKEGEEVLVFGYWHEKFQPLMCYLGPHRKGEWFTTVAGQ